MCRFLLKPFILFAIVPYEHTYTAHGSVENLPPSMLEVARSEAEERNSGLDDGWVPTVATTVYDDGRTYIGTIPRTEAAWVFYNILDVSDEYCYNGTRVAVLLDENKGECEKWGGEVVYVEMYAVDLICEYFDESEMCGNTLRDGYASTLSELYAAYPQNCNIASAQAVFVDTGSKMGTIPDCPPGQSLGPTSQPSTGGPTSEPDDSVPTSVPTSGRSSGPTSQPSGPTSSGGSNAGHSSSLLCPWYTTAVFAFISLF
eukprot:scaffold7902_cov129-Cylindrotheca_fusiformis.AAC.4